MDDPRAKLQADMKDAMRAQDKVKLGVIRMALNAIKQEEIDRRVTLNPEEVAAILLREAKSRRESIDEAVSLGRADVAAEVRIELEILEAYLPRQLTPEAIRDLVAAAIAEAGATSPKDMGNVMKVLMPKVKGQADGKLVNEIVREMLSGR